LKERDVIPKSILGAVTRLQKDQRSGAADLCLRAVSIFREYLKTTKATGKAELLQDLRVLCRALMFAQPAMASIQNACVEVLSFLAGHRDVKAPEPLRERLESKLSRMAADLYDSRPRIVHHFQKVLPEPAKIVTLSYSSTVVGVLKELKRRARGFEVFVLESRPLLEGRRTAEELVKARIPTTIIADAAMGEFVQDCDLALVGADTIFRDGSILNKIGTYPLALCCREERIPFYVLSDSSKLSLESPGSFVPEGKNPAALFRSPPRGLLVKNIYFEVTPAKYITAIFTEHGRFSARTLQRV